MVQNNNNITIQNLNININNIHPNVPVPPITFSFEEDEPIDFTFEHMLGNQRKYTGVMDIFKHLLENPKNLPIRKMDSKSAFSEVHVGDNKWELQCDHEITPIFLYHSLNAIKDSNILKFRFYSIMKEHCDALAQALETCLQSPEYKDERDQRELKKFQSEIKAYSQSLKRFMVQNGQRYKQIELLGPGPSSDLRASLPPNAST